jgi:hypothetical protein
MSINGIMNQTIPMFRPEISADDRAQAGITAAPITNPSADDTTNDDVINIKAMKTILYLGIKGEVYLPLDESHTVNTLA